MNERLTKSLTQNKISIKELFGDSVDFYTKDVSICGCKCCICMFEGLSSIERLWIMMLDILSQPGVSQREPEELFDYLMLRTAIPLESRSCLTLDDVRAQLTAGTSVILIDGVDRAVVLSTQSMQFRSVSEPSGEGNIRGSQFGAQARADGRSRRGDDDGGRKNADGACGAVSSFTRSGGTCPLTPAQNPRSKAAVRV